MHRITTIICNYNHEQYLADAIKSIAHQTHRKMDVVVVDDGSKHDPIDIITNSDWQGLNVKYIRNEANEGKWSCINKAIAVTDTRWYMIQDADDYAYPWKAESQLAALLETKTMLNLAGYLPIGVSDDHAIPNISEDQYNVIVGRELSDCAGLALRNPHVHHNYTGSYQVHNGASMFSRAFHELGFRFNPPDQGLRIARSEDSDYNLRCTLQFGKTSWLTKPCYSYRLGSGHPEGSF